MDYKEFIDPILNMLKSLPEGGFGAYVNWRKDGYVYSAAIAEQFGSIDSAQINLSRYKETPIVPGTP